MSAFPLLSILMSLTGCTLLFDSQGSELANSQDSGPGAQVKDAASLIPDALILLDANTQADSSGVVSPDAPTAIAIPCIDDSQYDFDSADFSNQPIFRRAATDNHCYIYFGREITPPAGSNDRGKRWQSAEDFCIGITNRASLKSHLVSITSQGEYDIVSGLTAASTIWIGYKKAATDFSLSDWTFTDESEAEPGFDIPWDLNEPNNVQTEHCGDQRPGETWHNQNCLVYNHFVCEVQLAQ